MSAMSTKTKRVKSAIVKTRKTISNKFKKLHSDQIEQERRLKERYAPITDSINKLIKVKKDVVLLDKNKSNNVNNNIHNEAVDALDSVSNNTDNGVVNALNDNIEEIGFESDDSNSINLTDGIPNEEYQEPKKIYKKLSRSVEQIREKERAERFNKSRNIRAGKNDACRSGLHESNDEDDDEEELGSTQILYKQPATKRPREDDNILGNKQKVRKQETSKTIAKEHEQNKRKANAVRYKQKKKNSTANSKPENFNKESKDSRISDHDYSIESLKRHSEIISPDDYDDNGNFIGFAPKRRKIVVPGKRSRRIASMPPTTYGRSLERKVIPYVENIVYEYYDDPNELCDRLKLLISSKGGGNSNHDQEINSIVEELRERNIII